MEPSPFGSEVFALPHVREQQKLKLSWPLFHRHGKTLFTKLFCSF